MLQFEKLPGTVCTFRAYAMTCRPRCSIPGTGPRPFKSALWQIPQGIVLSVFIVTSALPFSILPGGAYATKPDRGVRPPLGRLNVFRRLDDTLTNRLLPAVFDGKQHATGAICYESITPI